MNPCMPLHIRFFKIRIRLDDCPNGSHLFPARALQSPNFGHRMAPTVKLSRGQLTVEDCNIRYFVSHLCLRAGFAFRARGLHACAHTHAYIHKKMDAHTQANRHACALKYMYISAGAHIQTHTQAHTQAHTHMHAYFWGSARELTCENRCFQWGENRRDCPRGLPFGHPVCMCMHARVSGSVYMCMRVRACVRACMRA